jgi:exopolyphosphatase/pppGpp-phosphohydrolase
VTPDEARDMRPEQVETIAAQAARDNPNIMERISRFYAEHPQVVRVLGQVALGVAMNRMAMRRR